MDPSSKAAPTYTVVGYALEKHARSHRDRPWVEVDDDNAVFFAVQAIEAAGAANFISTYDNRVDAMLEADARNAGEAIPPRRADRAIYLEAGDEEARIVKALGAELDWAANRLCVKPNTDYGPLARWMTQPDRELYMGPTQNGKFYLAVPYEERELAEAMGARWDRTVKLWFVPEDSNLNQFVRWQPEIPLKPERYLRADLEFGLVLEDAGFIMDGPPEMDHKTHRVQARTETGELVEAEYIGMMGQQAFGVYRIGEKSEPPSQWRPTGLMLTDAQIEKLNNQNEFRRTFEFARFQRSACSKWFSADPVEMELDPHPYLEMKGVSSFGLRLDDGNNLLLPGVGANGEIRTIQSIAPDGAIRYEKGCRRDKSLFLIDPLGYISFTDPSLGHRELCHDYFADWRPDDSRTILLTEDYASGASLYMATGQPVAVVFESDNFRAAAQILRKEFPEAKLVLCPRAPVAGNDFSLKRAEEAASVLQLSSVKPPFRASPDGHGNGTFNALHLTGGLKAVREAVSPFLQVQVEKENESGVSR